MTDAQPTPSVREIADLTARLRRLSAAGRAADPAERAAFMADKDDLLDRIASAEPGTRGRAHGVPADEQERRAQLAAWHADDQAAGEALAAGNTPDEHGGAW